MDEGFDGRNEASLMSLPADVEMTGVQGRCMETSFYCCPGRAGVWWDGLNGVMCHCGPRRRSARGSSGEKGAGPWPGDDFGKRRSRFQSGDGA